MEKIIETTNGKTIVQTTLEINEKPNEDKIISKKKNKIPEMLEQEIEEFEEFVSQLASSGMKIKY